MKENNNEFLAQSGIKGQKWGERRFQNPDGSLTPEGRLRYQKPSTEKKKSSLKEDLAKAKERRRKENAEKQARKKKKKELDKQYKQLNEKDVNKVVNDVQFNRKCKDISKKDISKGEKIISDLSKTTLGINQTLANSIGIYNNVALVYNTIYDIMVLSGKNMYPLKKLPRLSPTGIKPTGIK